MNNEKAVKEFLHGFENISKAYFIGTTTKNSIDYKINEEIVFKIRVLSDEGNVEIPYISYTLEADDGQSSEGYLYPSEDGWFYISTSLKCAGFVHLIAKACDENKNIIDNIETYEGGAGADVENIFSGTEVPEDYFKFWERLKNDACENEPEVIYNKALTPEEIEKYVTADKRSGNEFYDMKIKVNEDMYVSCVVSYSKDAKPGSLKLAIFFRGYGVAPCTNIGADDGYLNVLINSHSIENFGTEEYYDSLQNNELFEYGRNNEENKNPDTTYWKQMFIRNMQAFSFFKNHELVNKKDYVFSGGSQGGMQAVNMAVHCGIECEAVIHVPWMADTEGTDKYDRIRGWRPDFEAGLRYFDSAVAARFLKCPVVIIAGLGDYICPPSGVLSMYNGITSPKKLVMVQNKTHARMPEQIFTYQLGMEKTPQNSTELLGTEYMKSLNML